MDFLKRVEDLMGGGVGAFVEIFLLFLVIYTFFKFLRDTRGAPVLRGVLVAIGLLIGIVFLAASLFQLEHITWVFEKLAALFFLALLIIFQPELRRGLLRLGLRTGVARSGSPTLAHIVEAATRMSQKSMGMLVAIEREEPLASYMEVGTEIDGEVSSELLQTIFFKDTALHDGAVIVQGNRIAAAGCLLPLSENPELAKTLGMRHRAAVGLSDESDAVLVTVSEETGRIGICVGGALEQGLSPDELRKKLTELCLESVEGGA